MHMHTPMYRVYVCMAIGKTMKNPGGGEKKQLHTESLYGTLSNNNYQITNTSQYRTLIWEASR